MTTLNHRIMGMIVAEKIDPGDAVAELGTAFAKCIVAAATSEEHVRVLAEAMGKALVIAVRYLAQDMDFSDSTDERQSSEN